MSVEIKISPNYEKWIRGFNHAEAEMHVAGQRRWEQATDVFFDRTQANVHILSGDLKDSGDAEVEVNAGELIGRITYDTDYAIYEEARGGSHAYIAQGWEATEEVFAQALPEAWEDVVMTWR